MAMRPADAEVAVDGDCHHDEGGEGHVAGDEEEVDLAEGVVDDEVVQRLHRHGEGHDDARGHEVGGGQADDEDGGGQLVLLPHVHVQHQGVAQGAEEREDGQHAHDGLLGAGRVGVDEGGPVPGCHDVLALVLHLEEPTQFKQHTQRYRASGLARRRTRGLHGSKIHGNRVR